MKKVFYIKMDYKKIGFKCGIEIHQQLEGKKLFCNCPTLNLRDTKSDIHFERKLRAVVGETGEIDKAAAHEMSKGKNYIYEGDSKDCCLVELDEEPPHPINQESVNTVLQIASLLKAKIVDEIQVMRKTVVDGSNTSGFQRTALVAYDGKLETSKGIVRISSICLEEEACQKIRDDKDSTTYRLDRLGIPLIEIATEPDIIDNDHAKETAEKIGMILRSVTGVKRGIGTIRQDVNISIKSHPRVEIKGFQEIKTMPKVIEQEIERQLKEKKPESHVRKVNPDGLTSFMRPMPGSARMYPETDVIPLRVDLSKIISSIELINEKQERYEKLGLSPDLAKTLSKSDKTEMFDEFIKKFKNIKPSFIASTLTSTVKEIERKFNMDINNLTNREFEEIFKVLDQGKISKDVVMDILIDYSSGKFESMDKYSSASSENLESEIKNIIDSKPGLSIGAYMGMIMGKFKGKIDGKKAMEILKKIIK
jgi:Glu-tRNA(Gln) amidotransferase subunit E-like FAD-binding protein